VERLGTGRLTRGNLVFQVLEADRLEACLEAFRLAGHVKVRGAEERLTRSHAAGKDPSRRKNQRICGIVLAGLAKMSSSSVEEFSP